MSGSGAILCCLLTLFASMYQQSEFRTWGSCHTNANDYITEWPVLGILLIAVVLLLIGIIGISLSYLSQKHENSIQDFISDWFSGWKQ